MAKKGTVGGVRRTLEGLLFGAVLGAGVLFGGKSSAQQPLHISLGYHHDASHVNTPETEEVVGTLGMSTHNYRKQEDISWQAFEDAFNDPLNTVVGHSVTPAGTEILIVDTPYFHIGDENGIDFTKDTSRAAHEMAKHIMIGKESYDEFKRIGQRMAPIEQLALMQILGETAKELYGERSSRSRARTLVARLKDTIARDVAEDVGVCRDIHPALAQVAMDIGLADGALAVMEPGHVYLVGCTGTDAFLQDYADVQLVRKGDVKALIRKRNRRVLGRFIGGNLLVDPDGEVIHRYHTRDGENVRDALGYNDTMLGPVCTNMFEEWGRGTHIELDLGNIQHVLSVSRYDYDTKGGRKEQLRYFGRVFRVQKGIDTGLEAATGAVIGLGLRSEPKVQRHGFSYHVSAEGRGGILYAEGKKENVLVAPTHFRGAFDCEYWFKNGMYLSLPLEAVIEGDCGFMFGEDVEEYDHSWLSCTITSGLGVGFRCGNNDFGVQGTVQTDINPNFIQGKKIKIHPQLGEIGALAYWAYTDTDNRVLVGAFHDHGNGYDTFGGLARFQNDTFEVSAQGSYAQPYGLTRGVGLGEVLEVEGNADVAVTDNVSIGGSLSYERKKFPKGSKTRSLDASLNVKVTLD